MNISGSRVVYFLLTILTFIAFAYFLPMKVIHKAPYAFAIVGSLLFTFFGMQAIVDFKSWSEFSHIPSNLITWKHKVAFFSIVPALIMVFVFHYLFAVR